MDSEPVWCSFIPKFFRRCRIAFSGFVPANTSSVLLVRSEVVALVELVMADDNPVLCSILLACWSRSDAL